MAIKHFEAVFEVYVRMYIRLYVACVAIWGMVGAVYLYDAY